MINSSSCLLLAAGKPDKSNPHQRKDQMEGKGDYGNCFFYAAKLASDWAPIKPQYQTAYKHLSAHRKRITDYAQGVWYKRQTVINIVKGVAQIKAENLTSKETKKWIVDGLPFILTIIKSQKRTIRQGTDQVAKEFIKQFAQSSSTSLEAFADELIYKERNANHGLFLCQTIPQFKDALNSNLRRRQAFKFLPDGDWGNQTLESQYNILHELFIQQAATILDFELAAWNPLKSVKVLKILLEIKGPLLAMGKLGKGCSTSAPILFKTDQYYDYYRWNSTNYQKTTGINGHAVVVIKAQAEPEESVNFLDPADGSPIGKKRKVYTLPYQIFCQSVCLTSGFLISVELDSYLWCRKSPFLKDTKVE